MENELTNTDQSQENIFLNFFCFRNILETAIRYWKIAVLCAVLGVVTSFVLTKWVITPIYMSKATIFSWRDGGRSEERNERLKSTEDFRQLQMAQMLINDYRALLESERVGDALKVLIETDFLEKHPELKGKPKKCWYSISIESKRETRVLTIVSQAHDKELAQYVAQKTAEIFKDKVEQVLHMNNVQIIDDAKLPTTPSNKSLKRNIPIGFVIGLGVGIALALLIGFTDQTIKNPEQAKRYLDIPVMGVIPKSKMPENRANLILEMLDNPKSQELVEAYRLLRTNLQYLSTKHSKTGGEIFMFTSSIPHEGKSSSIALVSLLTARAGKKVLLIDADMHKPVQSRIFNLRGRTGFVSVLTGDKTIEEAVQHVEDSFDVMPCGPIPPNPSELLMSEHMPKLLDELRTKYDYIFIDTTPALFLSDPLIITPLVDGVLFLIACSQTKIGMIQRSLRQMQQVSKTPIGLVINQFDRGEVGNRYGYYGYYRYHNYYRYYRDYANEDSVADTGNAQSSAGTKADGGQNKA